MKNSSKNRNRFGSMGNVAYSRKIAYDRSVREHIKMADILAMLVLHNEFGFGLERISRYYKAMYHLNEYYERYNGAHEPKLGRSEERSDAFYMAEDFAKAFGIPYEEFSDSMWDEAKEESNAAK